MWSIAKKTGTPFLEAYNWIMSRYRTDDGAGGNSEDVYEMTEAFFDGSGGKQGYEMGVFQSSKRLDAEELKGLTLSYSSMPAGTEPGSAEMLRDLEEVFHDHGSGGGVVLEYAIRVYCGRLPEA